MTYKVTVSSSNNHSVKPSQTLNPKITFGYDLQSYSVKSSQSLNPKVTFGYNLEIMPQYLDELVDVEITGTPDKYVLMYDSTTGKWRNVNPDAVLSASSNTETTQPGLPGDFVNTLDIDLDNKIDLDAGTF